MGRLLATILLGTSVCSCNWISLAKNALSYPEIQRGEVANLAVLDTLIYATMAQDGLAILSARSGRVLTALPPPAGSESVDDIAISDRLLFVLDARPPGHLSTYTLENSFRPRLVSAPREVPVGPFSGVSAANGLCVVSGGTSKLTAWRFDSTGVVAGPVATADLGRGQPDVLVDRTGRLLYVSTHYWGPYFGLDLVRFDPARAQLQKLAELRLDDAGFTEGGAKPANFPIDVAALSGDSVLVAYRRGIAVIGTDAPQHPKLLESIDVGGPAVNVAVLGGAAAVAVAGATPALVMLDLSGTRVKIARRIPLEKRILPMGVQLTTQYAIVAVRDHGVLIFRR